MGLWAGILLLMFSAPLSWSVTLEEADSATVLILLLSEDNEVISLGSGFFVTSEGHILTNAHVVDNPNIQKIKIYGKSVSQQGLHADAIWVVPEHDTAVLKTKKPSGITPLRLLSKNVEKGANVWALGYPGKQIENMQTFGETFDSVDATLTSGIASRVFEGTTSGDAKKYPIIQHTAEISQGNSGGPLIDECGMVVGMNTGITFDSSDEVDDTDFFAIGSAGLLKLLSTRIVGLTSVDQCVPDAEAPLPIVEREELDIEAAEALEPSTGAASGESQIPAHGTTQNKSLANTKTSAVWLLLIIAALGIFYFFYRSRMSRPSGAAPPLRPTLKEPINRADDTGAGQLLRISGFNENGSPVSFVFGSQSPYNQRGGIIGRASEFTDFSITNAEISKAHAQIKAIGETFHIRDLGSTNGTSLNGQKLAPFEYTKISFGDEISIATCTLAITN